jgi:hypothetical protein
MNSTDKDSYKIAALIKSVFTTWIEDDTKINNKYVYLHNLTNDIICPGCQNSKRTFISDLVLS